MIPHEFLCKAWEVVSADINVISNTVLLCIVDYYSRSPIVKKVSSLAADDLVQVTKMIFSEHGL